MKTFSMPKDKMNVEESAVFYGWVPAFEKF